MYTIDARANTVKELKTIIDVLAKKRKLNHINCLIRITETRRIVL